MMKLENNNSIHLGLALSTIYLSSEIEMYFSNLEDIARKTKNITIEN